MSSAVSLKFQQYNPGPTNEVNEINLVCWARERVFQTEQDYAYLIIVSYVGLTLQKEQN